MLKPGNIHLEYSIRKHRVHSFSGLSNFNNLSAQPTLGTMIGIIVPIYTSNTPEPQLKINRYLQSKQRYLEGNYLTGFILSWYTI